MSFEFSDQNREIEVHNYHESTGEYLSSAVLMIEAHTGLPALATAEVLPALGQNQVAVFKVDKWQSLEDHRGRIWNTATKELSELDEPGVIPAGKTKLEPGSFDEWDGVEWVLDTAAELYSGKQNAISAIREIATQFRVKVAGDADHYETAGWADKARRAERVVASTGIQAETNALAKEAELRGKGETAMQLAQLQLTKSERFALLIGDIDGITKAALDQINNTTNM
ncbi:MAG: hypothetical protein MJK13_12125, partial [Pseudomonadales bacterium]|nr:hypothetical protein [Pseudomonadales bacterium]